MSTNTVYCHILGGNVTIVSDLNGKVTNVVCPEYNRITHTCGLKRKDSGFFANVAKGMTDRLTGTKMKYCEFDEPFEL